METKFQWNEADMQTVSDAIQAAHDALAEAWLETERLHIDVVSDAGWIGKHKNEFAMWIDLVRQFNQQMASEEIGPAAVEALDAFLMVAAEFYDNSVLYQLLKSVS